MLNFKLTERAPEKFTTKRIFQKSTTPLFKEKTTPLLMRNTLYCHLDSLYECVISEMLVYVVCQPYYTALAYLGIPGSRGLNPYLLIKVIPIALSQNGGLHSLMR